ncbi:MAG: glycosyltransferase family 39 protein, partial [Deltaproteobacteria bacterium]|nr:glycosyltransferase family 39 protein [Deltaproteobacteria bacterium]
MHTDTITGSYERTYNKKQSLSHLLTLPSLQIVVLAIISFAIFFLNSGGWDLWNPDEPRYAQVAKEMMESGNWILPHHNNKVYPDKPPVFFWLIALSSMVKGEVTSFSARLPSALAAVLGVLLTYLLGSKIYNARAGFISALVLTTTVEYFWLGRRANIDMTLTLFFLSALFFFYRGYRESRRSSYYLFMGMATLTKGPVGFILPSLTVIFYLISKRDLKALKKVVFHRGFILFFAVVLVWLIPSFIQGGKSYMDEIIFNQILGRVHDSWSHKRPFYYYFVNLPYLVQPWFFFLPSAFIYFFTRRKKNKEDYLFPMVCFITIFTFFTLCSGKRELYLLPLLPAFALMVGFLWSKFFEQNEDILLKRLITIPFYLILGLLLAACLCVPFIPKSIGYEYRQAFHVYPLALFMGFSTILALFLLFKKKTVFSLILLIMMMAGSFFYAVGYVFPYLNQFKSAKPFSLRIKAQMKGGDLLGSYYVKTSPFNFYTG